MGRSPVASAAFCSSRGAPVPLPFLRGKSATPAPSPGRGKDGPEAAGALLATPELSRPSPPPGCRGKWGAVGAERPRVRARLSGRPPLAGPRLPVLAAGEVRQRLQDPPAGPAADPRDGRRERAQDPDGGAQPGQHRVAAQHPPPPGPQHRGQLHRRRPPAQAEGKGYARASEHQQSALGERSAAGRGSPALPRRSRTCLRNLKQRCAGGGAPEGLGRPGALGSAPGIRETRERPKRMGFGVPCLGGELGAARGLLGEGREATLPSAVGPSLRGYGVCVCVCGGGALRPARRLVRLDLAGGTCRG